MFGEELQALKGRVRGSTAICACSDDDLKAGIIVKWRDVGFSALPDESIRRYYTWQLGELKKLSDELSLNDPWQKFLLPLIDHLLTAHGNFCDLNQPAPRAFVDREKKQQFSYLFEVSDFNNRMGEWLKASIPEFYDSCSFLRLQFLTEVSNLLEPLIGSEHHSVSLLISLNFNYLGFYHHLCSIWAENNEAELILKRAEVNSLPVREDLRYDQRWPSIKELLSGWLKEKTELMKVAEIHKPKLHLNMSVAHLAFLIRLLKEEGVTAAFTLTDLLTQVSACVRTKKQPAISEGSLSKEFYGTDLHTAARVRDLLQRMIANINRRFFPFAAGFAIGVVLHALS